MRKRVRSRKGPRIHFWAMAICASLLWCLTAVLQSPPQAQTVHPDQGCGPDSESDYGQPDPIPNDPDNLEGWLVEKQVDDAGNALEIWCIKIAGGVGNSYGYRYTPAGGTPRWISRCAFEGGQNTYNKEPTGDANRNGKPDVWKTVTWTSADDSGGGAGDPSDDDQLPGKKDYDWEYDVASNNLKCWETLNGQRVRPTDPDYDGPAPENFGDVCGQSHESPDGKVKPGTKVNLHSHIGIQWDYELSGNDLIEFSPTIVFPGDRWSIAVSAVSDAFAPFGWSVDFSSTYVTWTYVSPDSLMLSQHGPLTGFVIVSPDPQGIVFWISDSQDDERLNFGHAGFTEGPVPPIPTLSQWGLIVLATLVLAAAVWIAVNRRRRLAPA